MMIRLPQLAKAGVGTRIYLTIAAIVILTIAASTVALLSFKNVGNTIQSLVDERYPVVETSRDLAQVATAMVALAPRLADAVTEQERAAVIARLDESDKRLRGIVDDLVKRHAIDRDHFIAMIDRLGAEIRQADAAAHQRIAMEAEKSKRAGELAKAAEAFNQAIVSMVDEAQFNLLLGLEGAVAGTDTDEIKKTLKALSDRDLPAYGAGLALIAEEQEVYGLLREVIVLDRAELLVPASDRYRALSARVAKTLREADKIEANPKRRSLTEAVIGFGAGEGSLFKLRERDFANRKTFAGNLAAATAAANALNAEIGRIVTEARTASTEATGSTKSLISNSSLWLILISVASILAAAAIAYFFVRPHLVERLARLSTATHAIAEGHLDTPIDASGADEIGEVARAVVVFRDAAIEKTRLEGLSAEHRQQVDEQRLRSEQERRTSAEAQANAAEEQARAVSALAEGLAKMAGGDLTVRLSEGFNEAYLQIRDDFNTTIARLQETISAIAVAAREAASASAEISASTTDLSQRTEEQAASLEQTTASMEEISATVKKNAENAHQANLFAASSRKVADQSGAVVASAVEAMSRIEQSSRKISDIIGVIDEIARQTNLLALNAAVEAARAGEAGRGFAVVASEVRSLAQRSAQAAKDIKDLITNSNGQVKDGVELVNRAGGSLTEIVASIKKVAEIVADIANASAEQASGIEQVNKALTQMDEVTQQNSALVEENAATAKTLEHQAKAMEERVAFFQLAAAEGGRMAQPANAREQRTIAAAPSRGPAAPKQQPVAAPKRVAAAGNSGGPVGRMHASLATAAKIDSDWKEF